MLHIRLNLSDNRPPGRVKKSKEYWGRKRWSMHVVLF
jgi:hypothetical protein